MAATITPDVLQDPMVSSLVCALAAANRKAEEIGIDLEQSTVHIMRMNVEETPVWRISYGPPATGLRRGGGTIIEVDADSAVFRRVLKGQ